MASNKTESIFTGIDIDSDDSDLCIRGRFIEDLRYEMDIARYYRALLSDNLTDLHSSKLSRRPKRCSKAVQTDPDTSGIPSSWLNLGLDLVTELYTGLGNMVNTLYHTPNGYCKGDDKIQSNSEDMKFFTYENGYWQSKLLPQIKIPGNFDMGRQIHSENFKKELYGLLEKATKLKNAIPYIMDIEQGKDPEAAEREMRTREDKNTSMIETEVIEQAIVQPGDESCSSNQGDCDSCASGFSEKSDTNSVVSGNNLQFQINENKLSANVKNRGIANKNAKGGGPKPVQGSVTSKSKYTHISVPKQHSSNKIFRKAVDSERVPKNNTNRNGLIIIEGKIANCIPPHQPLTTISNGTAVAGCSNSKRIQDMRSKVENACNSKREKKNNEKNCINDGEADSLPNNRKNFIKRNILASKFPANRATTSKALRDPGKPSVSQESGQQGKRI